MFNNYYWKLHKLFMESLDQCHICSGKNDEDCPHCQGKIVKQTEEKNEIK